MAFGYNSGNNVTGTSNIFLGENAGQSIGGNNNIFFGTGSGGNPSVSNAGAIGTNAFINIDNALNLGYQYVGINNSNPTAALHVMNSFRYEDGLQGAGKVLTSDINGNASWQTPSGGSIPNGIGPGDTPYWDGLAWQASNNIFNNNGNVGIGTSSPAAKLEIAGNVLISDGSQGLGKVLTSDASGLASWQPLGAVSSGWSLTGNAFTVDGTDFIGTTDNVPLTFKVNNVQSGRVDNATQNSFFGYGSGLNNTASSTSGFGSASLQNNTGSGNSAFGNLSLQSNTSGQRNTAIGNSALSANITGQENVAIGWWSQSFSTANSYNTMIGSQAFINSGDRNTHIGASTGASAGSDRVAIGYHALNGSSSSSVVAIGAGALAGSGSKDGAVAIGYNAAGSGTSGNGVAIGFESSNLSLGNNTAVGYQALKNTTKGNSTAIGHQALLNNSTGFVNVAIGYGAGVSSTTGSSNTFIGSSSGSNVTTGSNNIAIGDNAQVPTATASNQIRLGNTSINYAGVQVAWTITSDKRYKSNIQNSNLGLDFIKKLRPVSYTRLNDSTKKTEYGFIAQELEQVLNTSGAANSGIINKDDAGMYSVRYNDLISPLVKAVQEQQKLIETQKEDNDKLKKQLEFLMTEMEKIKKEISEKK